MPYWQDPAQRMLKALLRTPAVATARLAAVQGSEFSFVHGQVPVRRQARRPLRGPERPVRQPECAPDSRTTISEPNRDFSLDRRSTALPSTVASLPAIGLRAGLGISQEWPCYRGG